MNINDCAKVIKALGKAQSPVSVCIWGDPGSGKSARVKALAEEMGYGYFPMVASQREPVDIIGLPYIRPYKYTDPATGEKKEMQVTDYNPPVWFAQAVYEGKMILFLDELNRARPDVIKAVFELINERRLNNHYLHPSVIIVVACNPEDAESRNAVNNFDHAMTDRLLHLHSVSDYSTWKDWAKKTTKTGVGNIHPDIIEYLDGDKQNFTKHFEDTLTFPVTINQTGRSWERASFIHSVFETDEDLKSDRNRTLLETETLKGAVGADIAISFMQSLTTKVKPLTGEEVLLMSRETRAKLKKLTDKTDLTDMRLDVIKATMNNVSQKVNESKEEAVKYSKSILEFSKMLNEELFRMFLSAIVDNVNLASILLADPECKARLEEISKILTDAQTASENHEKAKANKQKP
jgi:hypothetical protein